MFGNLENLRRIFKFIVYEVMVMGGLNYKSCVNVLMQRLLCIKCLGNVSEFIFFLYTFVNERCGI